MQRMQRLVKELDNHVSQLVYEIHSASEESSNMHNV